MAQHPKISADILLGEEAFYGSSSSFASVLEIGDSRALPYGRHGNILSHIPDPSFARTLGAVQPYFPVLSFGLGPPPFHLEIKDNCFHGRKCFRSPNTTAVGEHHLSVIILLLGWSLLPQYLPWLSGLYRSIP